jgi:hypothetical protein
MANRLGQPWRILNACWRLVSHAAESKTECLHLRLATVMVPDRSVAGTKFESYEGGSSW